MEKQTNRAKMPSPTRKRRTHIAPAQSVPVVATPTRNWQPGEACLRALIENSFDAMMLISADGTRLYTSPATNRILGYSAEELVGHNTLEFVHSDDLPSASNCLRQLQETPGGTTTLRVRFQHKDGSWRWIEGIGKNLLHEPSVQAIVVNCRDVTERQHAEKEIRQLEEFNKDIIQNMFEGIIVENAEGYFTFVNPTAATLLGYAPEELLGKNWTTVVPPDQQAVVRAADARRMQGKTDRYELQVVRKDGTRRLVLVAGSPCFENDQFVGTLAVFTDITELKRAEDALRENGIKYQTLFESSSDAIFLETLDGHILDCNDPACQMFGYTKEELLRLTVADLVPEEMAAKLSTVIKEELTSGGISLETVNKKKNGKIFPCEVNTRLVKIGGTPLVLAHVRDITERKRAEQALRESEDRYRDLVESSPSILILHDLQGQVISANPAAAKLLGYTVDEITRWNVRDGLAPEVRDQFESYVATLQRDGQASGLMRVQTRAGEQRILEYTSTLRTAGVAAPIVRAMAHDVTELRRAASTQARLTRQMQALYKTSLEINSQTDLAQLLPTIVRRAADLLDARRGGLYLTQPDGATLELVVAHNLPGNYLGTRLHLGEGLSGRVAQTGQPMMVDDYASWAGKAAVYSQESFRRVLAVPLKPSNRVIGVLNVTDIEKTGPDQEEDIRLASLFADQAAIAIENARLFAETKQRADEFAALYQVVQDLAIPTDLTALLQTIIVRAIALLHVSSGAIFLYDAARGEVELTVTQGFPLPLRLRLKLGEGMAGSVAQTRQPLIVDDYSTWEHRLPQTEGIPFKASLDVPMIFGGELIGVLDLSETGDSPRKFTENEARLLSLFAAQAASVVYNARLLHQTQQRAQQLALLYDAVLTLNRAIEPHQVIEHLLRIASQSVHAERVDFFRYDPTQRTLAFESASGYATNFLPTLRTLKFKEGEEHGLIGLAAQERTPLYLSDVSTDPRWIPIDPAIRSALWVPVEHEQQLYGVLSVTSTRLDAFTPADQRLVALFANQVAVALERARLFQAEQNRRAELTALYDLARALTDTDALATVLNLVVRHAVETTPVTFVRLALVEGDTLVVQAAQPIRLLDRELGVGGRTLLANAPACQRALEQNDHVILSATDPEIGAEERAFVLLDLAKKILLVPLRAGSQALGLLMFGEMRHPEREPFTPEKIRLARSIGDQTVSAIRRTKLREQTEQRLRQLQALHTIEMTITASPDLNVTLNVLLAQVATQLRADASDILLFNPRTQMLEYVAGQGFRTKAIEHTSLRLGKEYAGRAALERTIVSAPDLRAQRETWVRSFLYTDEGFVSGACIPLIAKGQIKGVLEIFYRTPFQADPDWLDMADTLGTQAAIAIDSAELFDNLQRSNLELALGYNAAMDGWSRTIELRKPANVGHTQRVTELTVQLGRALGLAEPELIHLRHSALLHDVGMLSIPDSLLSRHGALTAEEEQILHHHPRAAYEILSPIAYLRPVLDIPYCHHENWDGSGYPRGLAGEQIPLAARIFAVAAAWDALTVGRPNQPAQTREQERKYLRTMAGKSFDPRVVEVFLQLVETNGEGNVNRTT